MYSRRQWHMSDLYSCIEINDAADEGTSPGNDSITVMAGKKALILFSGPYGKFRI